MKILHLVSVRENKARGLSFSVPNLIKSQNYNLTSPISFLLNTKDGVKVKKKELSKYNVVVLHSFFILGYFKVLWLVSKECKIIICPRGAFSKSNKYALKKQIYSLVYFSIIKFRKLNYKIHFLTEEEKTRSRFKTKKDFVVGNCITVKELNQNIENKYNNKEIVYVGRFSIHIKGLDLLFEYLINNNSFFVEAGYTFKFYGPDNKDKDKLIELRNKHMLNNIFFYPEVYGNSKETVFKNATFNILNSRSEGYPMAVLETLAMSTPQLLSKGTNMLNASLLYNFGFEINEGLINNIKNIDYESYRQMCINAHAFAKKHDISLIGKETIQQYIK